MELGYLYHLKVPTELVDKKLTLKTPIKLEKLSIILIYHIYSGKLSSLLEGLYNSWFPRSTPLFLYIYKVGEGL